MKKRVPTILALSVTALAFLAPRGALADAKSEAAARFDRGIALFDAHDYTRALAELRRAYELAPNAEVLYDIALIEVALAKPVEAVAALDGVLAAPVGLASAELAKAKQLRLTQGALVAALTVKSNVVGAHIELDGIEVATTPLAKPIAVASGTHVIALIAPGYVPRRREVTIAGNVDQALEVLLEPMEGRLAHLVVRSHVPGADVYANGQRIGTTPLRASLAFAPGTYSVEARRADYATATVSMKLDEGATGEVALEPIPDASAVLHDGAILRVEASEPGATLTIDGRALGVASDAVPLAPGTHDVVVEHAGFAAVERSVTLDAHRESMVRAYLAPTNETRAEYVARTSSRRVWSTALLGTGAALVAASAVYAIPQRREDLERADDLRQLRAQRDAGRRRSV